MQTEWESLCDAVWWIISAPSFPSLYRPLYVNRLLLLAANRHLSSFLLLLPASLCLCCHGDRWCSPIRTLFVSSLARYGDKADSWPVMQAGCRRHHFPLEEGLFLPEDTKCSKLLNIFMEAPLIPAWQETSLPMPCALFPCLFGQKFP